MHKLPPPSLPAAHSKEMDRPAAADRMKERAQSEQKDGAKEMPRGEAPEAVRAQQTGAGAAGAQIEGADPARSGSAR